MQWGNDPEVYTLQCKMYEYEQDHFSDMTLNEGWLAELSKIALDEFDYIPTTIDRVSEVRIEKLEDGVCGCYDIANKTITISPDYAEDKPIILHEMLHFYEENVKSINPALCEALLIVLYRKLSALIPNIDKQIAEHADLYYLGELESSGGNHGILFYLKSLDLDLQCGYKFGTVFGYGYDE